MAATRAKSSVKSAAKSTTVSFEKEKETKGTVRYAEQVEEDSPKVVGTLYLQKPAAEALGNPESLTVTIKAS
jgi:hypothetical protein